MKKLALLFIFIIIFSSVSIFSILGVQSEIRPTDLDNKLDNKLIGSIVNYDSDLVKSLLKEGANPNAKNTNGYPALFLAVDSYDERHGSADIINYLIDAGAGSSLTFSDKEGETVLMRMLKAQGQKTMNFVEAFLKIGKDNNIDIGLNKANAQGHTPLLMVVEASRDIYDKEIRESDIYLVEKLIEYGADPNLTAGLLISYGDDNLVGKNTPLMVAVAVQNLYIVDILLKNGANPNLANDRGDTPLMYALQFKDTSNFFNRIIILKLLVAGTDPDQKNNKGISPRMIAPILIKQSEELKFLSQKSA